MPGEEPFPLPHEVDAGVQHLAEVLATRERLCLYRPDLTPAAVMLLLLKREDDWHLLFTLRTRHVTHHKGQVSFPGGARHGDDRDAAATALRETHEEIGLPPEAVQLVGALDDLATISNYLVTPFVGTLQAPPELAPSPAETHEVFWVPLSRLLDPEHWEITERRLGDRLHYPVWHFVGAEHRIWGITGHITAHFLEVTFGWRHPQFDPSRVSLDGHR